MNYNCGTYGGYQRHHRNGEDPCEPCRKAANAYQRSRRTDSRKRAHENAQNNARTRALWRLAHEHQEQFRALVAEELAKTSSETPPASGSRDLLPAGANNPARSNP